MGSIELHLDEQVIERARRLAEVRHSTVEDVLTDIITRGVATGDADRWLGMFADDAELLEEMAAWEAASDEDWLKLEQSMPQAD